MLNSIVETADVVTNDKWIGCDVAVVSLGIIIITTISITGVFHEWLTW